MFLQHFNKVLCVQKLQFKNIYMKISGAVIQKRNIESSTEDDFIATYKGKQLYISTNHSLGEPKFAHLKRFDIVVTDLESGMLDVQTYEDFHEIKDAIRYALIGACLIS